MNNSISNKDKILDISVNLARISDWILSNTKQNRVDQFLEETRDFLLTFSDNSVSEKFKPTFKQFTKEFNKLMRDRNQEDRLEWAERALTWANILQHRAKLA